MHPAPCRNADKGMERSNTQTFSLNQKSCQVDEVAERIKAEGGCAKGYACNVLSKDNCFAVAEQVMEDMGPCDILINGADGNNAKANTDKEFFETIRLCIM